MNSLAMNSKAIDNLSEKELLNTRICDLSLHLSDVAFAAELNQLQNELSQRELIFSPNIWLADDWFSPDGTPGFAIPFYLCHKKLIRLQRKYVGLVEGTNAKEFLKLIRHETAHAMDNAFYLRRNKKRQSLFGLTSTPYPISYDFNPHSKNHVLHLDDHYAQAHPDEDWAETFAVWLTPNSDWKKKYKLWPAIEKLELLDQLMNNLKGVQPKNTKGSKDYITSQCLSSDTRTLQEYYQEKKEELKLNKKNFFHGKMNEVFTRSSSQNLVQEDAFEFIKTYKKALGKNITKRKKIYPHIIKKMITDMSKECKSNKYHLKYSQEQTKQILENTIAKSSVKFIREGRHRIVM